MEVEEEIDSMPRRKKKRTTLPDEELFISPLLFDGYSYCRNDVRWNSKNY